MPRCGILYFIYRYNNYSNKIYLATLNVSTARVVNHSVYMQVTILNESFPLYLDEQSTSSFERLPEFNPRTPLNIQLDDFRLYHHTFVVLCRERVWGLCVSARELQQQTVRGSAYRQHERERRDGSQQTPWGNLIHFVTYRGADADAVAGSTVEPAIKGTFMGPTDF